MAEDATKLPTFDVLPLSAEVRRAVDEVGYVHPTPVQAAVFEPASRGKDLVVQARTGTGKTAAFVLPLVDSIVKRGTPAVQALVLCPTRELALQVTREVEVLAKYRGVRSSAVYGGAPMARQVSDIRGGAQIVVGTPGRVLDHLHRKTMDPSTIRTLVLDESDEMLSMGFLPQISDIMSFLPPARQTLLFSATLPPDIRRVAETRLRSPEFLTLSGDHIGALEIQHFVYVVPTDKLAALISLIEVEDPESAIVFCNTKDETKRVAAALEQQGFAAAWLNADLPQNDRERVMAATREGQLRFLVATDVAARGIDISHLTHVINYDFPESAEAYVHRTGRTGRAGRTGVAIALVGPRDVGNLYLLRLTYKLKPIERQLPSARETKTRQEADLLKLFTDAFGSRRPHPDDLALARRLLTHEQAELVVAGLLRDHLGARPEALDEATAARRARAPSPPKKPAEAEPADATSAPLAAESATKPREERPRDDRPRRDDGPRGDRPRRDEPPRGDRPRRDEPTRADRPRRDDAPRPDRGRRDDGPRGDRPRRDRDELPRYQVSDATGSEDLPKYQVSDAPALTPLTTPSQPEGIATPAAAPPLAAAAPAPEARAEPAEAVRANGAEAEADDIGDENADACSNGNEIYVNVGRRDGAKPSDYQTLLEAAGIGPDITEYVRVRHRHAFVGVRGDQLDRVIAVLNGATIAGRRASAERARRD
jgi:ATP-dependent RNA helicase DeaD